MMYGNKTEELTNAGKNPNFKYNYINPDGNSEYLEYPILTKLNTFNMSDKDVDTYVNSVKEKLFKIYTKLDYNEKNKYMDFNNKSEFDLTSYINYLITYEYELDGLLINTDNINHNRSKLNDYDKSDGKSKRTGKRRTDNIDTCLNIIDKHIELIEKYHALLNYNKKLINHIYDLDKDLAIKLELTPAQYSAYTLLCRGKVKREIFNSIYEYFDLINDKQKLTPNAIRYGWGITDDGEIVDKDLFCKIYNYDDFPTDVFFGMDGSDDYGIICVKCNDNWINAKNMEDLFSKAYSPKYTKSQFYTILKNLEDNDLINLIKDIEGKITIEKTITGELIYNILNMNV